MIRAGLPLAVLAVLAALAVPAILSDGGDRPDLVDGRSRSGARGSRASGSGPPRLAIWTTPAGRTAFAGAAGVVCPPGARLVDPTERVQAVIDATPTNRVICLRRGVYPLPSALRPKSHQQIYGEGAILSGAKSVSHWSFDGRYWAAGGQTQSIPTPPNLRCEEDGVQCEFEDLFMDDRPLPRVPGLGDLDPGTFYFDERNDKIYVQNNPTGHKMEATATDKLIIADGAKGVTLRGLILEKCGRSAVNTGIGWIVQGVESRYCHGIGLSVFGSHNVIRNAYVHDSGQMGIFCRGTSQLFDQVAIEGSNYVDFSFARGGAKCIRSDGVVVMNSWLHDNRGGGWHFDWDNINWRFENNLVERNQMGLMVEASFRGIARDNVFRRNGFVYPDELAAAVFINSSSGIEITQNVFEDNQQPLGFEDQRRGTSERYGPRQLRNLNIHDNRGGMGP